MVDFVIAEEAPSEGIPRQKRFLSEIEDSQFASLVERIETTTDDLEFGAPISKIIAEYRFASREHTADFFRRYLERRNGAGRVDEDLVQQFADATVNCSSNGHATAADTRRSFTEIAADFIDTVNANTRKAKPTVQYVVGPTGAGKTAFSRAIFTVALQQFWKERIIPSRVEYSKLPRLQEDGLDTSEFFHLIRHCQTRDLMIYFFHSGEYDREERKRIISGLGLGGGHVALEQYNNAHDVVVDGENNTVAADLRSAIRSLLIELKSSKELELVLYRLSPRLEVRFLVSFDGFDTIKIDHFLFRDKVPSPIVHLAHLLRGWFEKSMESDPNTHDLSVHYLAYVRDTTFERLRVEVNKKISSRKDIPRYWIVPPPYRLLVDNAVRHIVQRPGYRTDDVADSIAASIEQLFDKNVLSDTGLNARNHMHFAFGSSARSMKRHVKYTFFSTMQRALHSGEIRSRIGIGVDPVWFVRMVAESLNHRYPKYILFEDLFLNDFRHLLPKLGLSHTPFSRMVEKEDLDAIVGHIRDRDEETGIYGCVFNYLFHCNVLADGEKPQPGLLVLIRAIQFVSRHHHCSSGEVFGFLKSIGYDLTEFELQVVLYVLLRAELIKWDGSSGNTRIEDVPLFVTTRGIISTTKLPFVISYVSEAMMSALQSDVRVRDALIKRHTDVRVWVADCISNASIGLAIVKQIENLEAANASRNQVDLAGYLMHREMHEELSRQASLILGQKADRTERRWAENRVALLQVAKWLPSLTILGETEK